MDCKRAKYLIPFALDGELDRNKGAELDAHLDSCKSCAAYWSFERELITDLELRLDLAAKEVALPVDWATSVTLAAVSEISHRPKLAKSLSDCYSRMSSMLTTDFRVIAATACVVAMGLIGFIGAVAGQILDSSPVVTAKVTSGRLVAFTVHPKADGAEANIDSRNVCRVSKSSEEILQ